jgi:hypothetical protein
MPQKSDRAASTAKQEAQRGRAEITRQTREVDALLRKGLAVEAGRLLAEMPPVRELLPRRLMAFIGQGDIAQAESTRAALLEGLTAAEARHWVGECWRWSRLLIHRNDPAAATVAAVTASLMLDRHDVLAGIAEARLSEGLLADSRDAEGRWTLAILARLRQAGGGIDIAMKFLSGLGGNRPHLGGQRPLDVLAKRARAMIDNAEADPGLRDAATIVLFGAQDFAGTLAAAKGGEPGSFRATVEQDVTRRLAIGRDLRQRALASPAPVLAAGKDQPPFIVVHRGQQEYVALCASSLALQNGAGNVVLMGDDSTAGLGIGRFAALTDYFDDAGVLAKRFHHHSVMEATYGLFSFQRWLIVAEYCRKNRIDQCVVIDSDALAFSPASDIIAGMPPGIAMNDWTWTTTVRDTAGLTALSQFTLNIYDRSPEEIEKIAMARGKLVANGTRRTFQDMHLFYYFRDENPAIMGSQYAVPFHGGLDQAATLDNGVEIGSPNELTMMVPGRPMKRPYLQDGKLYFRSTEGEMVRFHTVHCQGPAKAAMHHYAALLLPGAAEAAAGWKADAAPVRAPAPAKAEAPQAEPAKPAAPPAAARPAPAAPKPAAPPPGPLPMPNLRLPEHAGLQARVRAAVAAATPLRASATVSLPNGPSTPARRQLPVSVIVRNDGAQPLPVVVDGHVAMQVGFRITPVAPDAKAREARLLVPGTSLGAGQEVLVRGQLPTHKLPPGKYRVSADLVFDYVRWVAKDQASLPAVTIEIAG